MKAWLLELLCCPSCKGNLALENEVVIKSEIESGVLICSQCSSTFAIKGYIPRFTPSDQYVGNFSLQWHRHATTQFGNESVESFSLKTGLALDDVKGKLILDGGCGSGRFCDVVARHGGRVVGVDLSYSIDAAFKEIGFNENIAFVQGDLLNLPFKPGVFDVAFSIGVVHHTRNSKQAAGEIARTVKSGGQMAIWVYAHWKDLNHNDRLSRVHTMLSYALSDFYRIFTSRMSSERLYRLITGLDFIRSQKQGNKWRAFILDVLFRSSNNPDPSYWLLETFDWYSPRYHFKHTYDEVTGWFNEFGFAEVQKIAFPVAIKGIMKN